MLIDVPANSRAQLSRMRSKTGAVSAIELLIAVSTSPDARCWSSASFVSLNRRTFSRAIAAWSPNVCSSAISRSLNGPVARRPTQSAPSARSSPSSGAKMIDWKPTARAPCSTCGGACEPGPNTSGKCTTLRSSIACPEPLSRAMGYGYTASTASLFSPA